MEGRKEATTRFIIVLTLGNRLIIELGDVHAQNKETLIFDTFLQRTGPTNHIRRQIRGT